MEQQELLETFTFCILQDSHEHAYRVTAQEDRYVLEKDGIFIAELKCENSVWKQSEGQRLGNAFVREVGDRIEDYFC